MGKKQRELLGEGGCNSLLSNLVQIADDWWSLRPWEGVMDLYRGFSFLLLCNGINIMMKEDEEMF